MILVGSGKCDGWNPINLHPYLAASLPIKRNLGMIVISSLACNVSL